MRGSGISSAGQLRPAQEDTPLPKKYSVTLTPEERHSLEQMVRSGKASGGCRESEVSRRVESQRVRAYETQGDGAGWPGPGWA